MTTESTNTTGGERRDGSGLSEGLGASVRSAPKPHRRRQLFPGERWVMFGLLAMGVVSTAATGNWAGLGWCLTCAVWCFYSFALEDRLDDVGA